jgi:hypothetical protein
LIDLKKLHAYSDGELSGIEKAEVEAQLSLCQESQRELLAISQLKNQLRKVDPLQCSVTWSECKKRLDQIDRIEKSGNFITRYSWAMVGCVALMVFAGTTISRNSESKKIYSESLANVVAGVSKRAPSDPAKQDALDRILKVVDSRLSQVSVGSEQSVLVDGIPSSVYAVYDRIGPLQLVVIPAKVNFEGLNQLPYEKYSAGQVAPKVNSVVWSAKGRSLILVGDRSHLDLMRIAKANFVAAE